jgi:hypothetical protein
MIEVLDCMKQTVFVLQTVCTVGKYIDHLDRFHYKALFLLLIKQRAMRIVKKRQIGRKALEILCSLSEQDIALWIGQGRSDTSSRIRIIVSSARCASW